MAWTAKHRRMRDRIRANYLATTGRESFDPDAFLAWVREQPDHEAHAWVFSEASADEG